MLNNTVGFILFALLFLGSFQARSEGLAEYGKVVENVRSATIQAVAETREVIGTVFVNLGKIYQPAQSGMQVTEHARVITRENSSVVVISKLGCSTRVGPNSMFVVETPDPCHGGLATVQKIDPATVANLGAGSGGLSTSTIALIAGGVIATGVGVGVGASSGGGGGGQNCAIVPAVSPDSPRLICQ